MSEQNSSFVNEKVVLIVITVVYGVIPKSVFGCDCEFFHSSQNLTFSSILLLSSNLLSYLRSFSIKILYKFVVSHIKATSSVHRRLSETVQQNLVTTHVLLMKAILYRQVNEIIRNVSAAAGPVTSDFPQRY
jgi:hypothetical protein